MNNSDKKALIEQILRHDLTFDEYIGPSIHRIHGFAAKFPPELPRYFVNKLSESNDVILDPMVGSGTTLVESLILKRKAIGIDLDPLALLQSRVKTQYYDPNKIKSISKTIAYEVSVELMEKGYPEEERDVDKYLIDYDEKTKNFFKYWFFPKTIAELKLLSEKIKDINNQTLKSCLELAFSATIIQKRSGVSRAIDLTHTRPHRDLDKIPQPAPPFFIKNANKIADAYKEMEKYAINYDDVKLLSSDARNIPLDNESVDLIVTSPPYANALDYMRAHKFSLSWLGYDIPSLSDLRGKYIGSEKSAQEIDINLDTLYTSLTKLEKIDPKKANIFRKYFHEMKLSIKEMYRVLRSNRYAVIIVGPSTSRNIPIMTHGGLAEISQQEGFTLIGLKKREIDRDSRHLPFNKETENEGIEARIHTEYALIVEK